MAKTPDKRKLKIKKPTQVVDEKDAENKLKEGSDGPMPKEINGPDGPEPTRFGDWEVGGRCTDF